MTAVIAISQRQVDSLIEPHLHSTADQRLDGVDVIIYRIFHILDLTSIGQFPETVFQILLLDGRDILRHMAVKAVGHILSVRHPLDDTVLGPELFHLQAAEILRRRAVDRIQITVRFLILRYLLVNMF